MSLTPLMRRDSQNLKEPLVSMQNFSCTVISSCVVAQFSSLFCLLLVLELPRVAC